MRISGIHLYECDGVDTHTVALFLNEMFGISCSSSHLSCPANMMEACAIGDVYRRHAPHSGIKPITHNGQRLYDGHHLLDAMGSVVQYGSDAFHIIFTNLLVCTYDDSDSRYHARSIISANPSIISIPGIIEAPAKSREYYVDLMTGNTDLSKHDGQFLTYDDHTRLEQVIQGYCMQCIFYYESGEAFCMDKDCRLYNAHWQADLLHSQIESGKLCDHHGAILHQMKAS